MKAHRGAMRREQLAPFPALEIRVEHEPTIVDVLEQHDANARLAVRADGTERECGGLGKPIARNPFRFGEQRLKARDRVVARRRGHPIARL